jgi:hypothetical protein
VQNFWTRSVAELLVTLRQDTQQKNSLNSEHLRETQRSMPLALKTGLPHEVAGVLVAIREVEVLADVVDDRAATQEEDLIHML